jgi:hypothetical protein
VAKFTRFFKQHEHHQLLHEKPKMEIVHSSYSGNVFNSSERVYGEFSKEATMYDNGFEWDHSIGAWRRGKDIVQNDRTALMCTTSYYPAKEESHIRCSVCYEAVSWEDYRILDICPNCFEPLIMSQDNFN